MNSGSPSIIVAADRNRAEVDGEEFIADELYEICRDATSLRQGQPSEEAIGSWPMPKIFAVYTALRAAGYGRDQLFQLRMTVQERAGARRVQSVLLPVTFDDLAAAQQASAGLASLFAAAPSVHPASGILTTVSVTVVPKK